MHQSAPCTRNGVLPGRGQNDLSNSRPAISRTDSRDRAVSMEQRQLGRAGCPTDRRDIGLGGYTALGYPGYIADRRLAKTANLVFQAPPWATTNEPKRAVRRNYSTTGRRTPSTRSREGRGTRSREEPRRRELYDTTGLGLRRSVAVPSRTTSSTPTAATRTPGTPSQQRSDSSAGRAKDAVKEAPRPIVCRTSKSTDKAVVALDSNLHYRAYMEDGHKIIDRLYAFKDQQWGYYAVYDGHGGRQVTDKCLALMHEIVHNELVTLTDFPTPTSMDVRRALEKAFCSMDETLKTKDAWHCGATCTVTLVHTQRDVGKKLYVANVGDSRCVLVSGDRVVRTSVDHRANDPDEMFRVQSEGGIISRGRVGGQLMLTRALGDFALKNIGVSCLPYTSCHHLKPDDAVIIASDGLWDVLTDSEAGRLCNATRAKYGNEKIVAKTLVDHSIHLGSTDNVTCVVLFT